MDQMGARKVRQHGMSDPRWTTRDKIVQYKGLVKLYKRDRQIAGYAKEDYRKQQIQHQRKLSKELAKSRDVLDKYINGDRQKIRNSLRRHPKLLLAYGDLPVDSIIEHIYQDNFNLRKTLDRLMYKLKVKQNKLIDLKISKAAYQDLLMELNESNAIDIQIKIVTGKFQDTILKRDAAISVKNIYEEIVHYIYKDRVYINAVLDCLEADTAKQGECILRSIVFGQVATEQLDDKMNEYKKMEKMVQAELVNSRRQVKALAQTATKVKRKLRQSVRRESSVEMIPYFGDLRSPESLAELEDLENMLKKLEEVTMTTDPTDIFPYMDRQEKQLDIYESLVEKLTDGKDRLENKVNHARACLDYQLYDVQESSMEHDLTEQLLKAEIEEVDETLENTYRQLSSLHELFAKLDAAITQLDIVCNQVAPHLIPATPGEKFVADRPKFRNTFEAVSAKIEALALTSQDVYLPEMDMNARSDFHSSIRFMTRDLSHYNIASDVDLMESYTNFVRADESAIPTRTSIKEESEQIRSAGLRSIEFKY